MPTREEICRITESILQSYTSNPAECWKGIYKALLWYAEGVPHIVEANCLRRGIWRKRAQQVEKTLAKAFSYAPGSVEKQLDQLMKHPDLRGIQRQNPLGIGFTCAVVYFLRHHCPDYTFLDEAAVGTQVLKEVTHPPRRAIDIAALKDGKEQAIISAKWSIRHDRLRDLLDECAVYRESRPELKFYVVTNEFIPARLRKLVENPCVDEVFHVNREIVLAVNDGNDRLVGLKDLKDIFKEFP